MSVEQEHDPRVHTPKKTSTLPETVHRPPVEDQGDKGRMVGRRWLAPYRWFLSHTFTPLWLPKRWRHPIVGYFVAMLLQFIAAFITSLLLIVFPSFTFIALLEVLAVALVALNWGAGPSLVGTLVGVALLNFVAQPRLTWSFSSPTNLVGLFLFLLVGVTISIVASRFE